MLANICIAMEMPCSVVLHFILVPRTTDMSNKSKLFLLDTGVTCFMRQAGGLLWPAGTTQLGSS